MALFFVNLDCPTCGSTLEGEHHDILFICTHCFNGAIIGASGLEHIETTALLPTAGRRATSWRPAWLLETSVRISKRRAAGGPPTGATRRERTFIVPAYDLPFSDLRKLTQALIKFDGKLTEVPREAIRGGTLSMADARTFIRHIVVGEEVHKPDKLVSVEVEITIQKHRLAALPFEEIKGRLICGVTGTKI